jgi:hypothetical protein
MNNTECMKKKLPELKAMAKALNIRVSNKRKQQLCDEIMAVMNHKRSPSPKRSSSPRRRSPCSEWQQKPSVNPLTNRKIKKNGPVYKKLEKECGHSKSLHDLSKGDLIELADKHGINNYDIEHADNLIDYIEEKIKGPKQTWKATITKDDLLAYAYNIDIFINDMRFWKRAQMIDFITRRYPEIDELTILEFKDVQREKRKALNKKSPKIIRTVTRAGGPTIVVSATSISPKPNKYGIVRTITRAGGKPQYY